jgi:hypothetical protein
MVVNTPTCDDPRSKKVGQTVNPYAATSATSLPVRKACNVFHAHVNLRTPARLHRNTTRVWLLRCAVMVLLKANQPIRISY